MKKVILVLALCLLGVLLFAQERVAVLPFTGGEGREGDNIARFLGTELTELGGFDIVPRTAAINKIMEEHEFQRGGLTDGDTIVALGKGANADYVVSGHIQTLGNRKMISASIVNVETFQQVAGDYYEYDDLSEVVDYLPTLAKNLVSKTKNDYSNVPTLAILPFDGVDENNADVLAQLLSIELANSGKYVVVTRTTTIENIMKEQDIQRSGLTDSDTISKLGIAMNAEFVLSGAVSRIGNTDYMNVEIINALTQVQKDGEYIEYTTIEEGMELMPQLSYDLTGVESDKGNIEVEPETVSATTLAMYEGKKGIEEIKALIARGIHAVDDDGYTALIHAAAYGYTELVKALITDGYNINAKTYEDKSAFMIASQNGHRGAMIVLKDAGADVTVKMGDTGPGGGLVFYISGSTYYEVSDKLGSADWEGAKRMAKSHRGGGYSDWYLPNKTELNYIYENLAERGFIEVSGVFWSSSEYTNRNAWLQFFYDGNQNDYYKSNSYYVRAIRAFNYSSL